MVDATQPGASERAARVHDGMIEAVAPPEKIRRAYDLYSRFYGALIAPLERMPRMRALDRVAIGPHERVLEVATGPGETFAHIVARVAPENIVEGVDLSPRMLERTRRRAARTGRGNFHLQQADARKLPFADNTFDALYNSYMLDLIPFADMPPVLAEFHRVLKPGGRLVLVNLSKRDAATRPWLERLYQRLPRRWVPFVFGGCRPVLMERLVRAAGFADVERQFVRHWMHTEIVTARKSSPRPRSSEEER